MTNEKFKQMKQLKRKLNGTKELGYKLSWIIDYQKANNEDSAKLDMLSSNMKNVDYVLPMDLIKDMYDVTVKQLTKLEKEWEEL